MSPITHLLISWTTANTQKLNRRERIIVTISGIIPDIDGLGIIFDYIFKIFGRELHLWGKLHHVLGHNIGLGLLTAAVAFCLSVRRTTTALLALLVFHIHLFCDIIGARGPDGYQWPIPYLLPLSNKLQITWDGQWALNAWPNFLVTGICIILVFYIAWKRGYSPLEIISKKLDQGFVNAIRTRFGNPNPEKQS